MEGTIGAAFTEIRDAMTASPAARMGAFLQRRRLQDLRDRLDPDTYGGGVLLGLNGTVVIAHGASHARAITSACALAHRLAAGRIVERIREQVAATRTSRFGRWTHGERDGRENPDRTAEGPAKPPSDAPPPPREPAGDTLPDRNEPPALP
jgi:glycerol-3-phosphate acyltransferase PlsX